MYSLMAVCYARILNLDWNSYWYKRLCNSRYNSWNCKSCCFTDFFCSLVTLIRHTPDMMGVPLHQQQNKCTTLVKNKTAATTTALQFTCPLFNPNAASPANGNANTSQSQVGNFFKTVVIFFPYCYDSKSLEESTVKRSWQSGFQVVITGCQLVSELWQPHEFFVVVV